MLFVIPLYFQISAHLFLYSVSTLLYQISNTCIKLFKICYQNDINSLLEHNTMFFVKELIWFLRHKWIKIRDRISYSLKIFPLWQHLFPSFFNVDDIKNLSSYTLHSLLVLHWKTSQKINRIIVWQLIEKEQKGCV